MLINALDLAVRADGCRDAVIEDVHVHPQYMGSLLKFIGSDAPITGSDAEKRHRDLVKQAVERAMACVTCFEIGAGTGHRFVNPSTWPCDVGFRVTSSKAKAHILSCTLETNVPLWLEEAGRIELINANAPTVGIRSDPKFAGQAHVVNYMLRHGGRGRQSLDLQGPGNIQLTQCWFKWFTKDGQELLFKNGNLRLLGGVMVDVKDWQRGLGRMELTGAIVNVNLFSPELKECRAGVGVKPCK